MDYSYVPDVVSIATRDSTSATAAEFRNGTLDRKPGTATI